MVRAVERGLEIALGVAAFQEMAVGADGAGADLADGVHRLAVLAEIDVAGQHLHHAELVRVHDELLIA